MAHRPVELDLLADPSLRCAVALAHARHEVGLELLWADGRRSWVGHDPAFGPVMSPCHLRLALARAAVGSAPRWLAAVERWDVGGPFVELLGGGVVAAGRPDDRWAAFATTLTPVVARELVTLLGGGPAGTDDVEVRLRADPAVGATVAQVGAGPGGGRIVDLAAVALAAACRRREHVLRGRVSPPA